MVAAAKSGLPDETSRRELRRRVLLFAEGTERFIEECAEVRVEERRN
jgi:hypothetical protein